MNILKALITLIVYLWFLNFPPAADQITQNNPLKCVTHLSVHFSDLKIAQWPTSVCDPLKCARTVAFQNIKIFSNPPSINIFLVRRKLMRFWKNRMNSIKIEAKSEPEPWFCVHIQILLWILDPVPKILDIFVEFF